MATKRCKFCAKKMVYSETESAEVWTCPRCGWIEATKKEASQDVENSVDKAEE